MSVSPNIVRRQWKISPDPSLVICRPHVPHGGPLRIGHILRRILALSNSEAKLLLEEVMANFADRHRHLRRTFGQHFDLVEAYLPNGVKLNETLRLLIGSYFTMEYAVASAALFNPSIVPHPDQRGMKAGSLRFIMSLRAVGEGHISSIVFRSGVMAGNGKIRFDKDTHYIETPLRHIESSFDKQLFERKLSEMSANNEFTAQLLENLPEHFSFNLLQVEIDRLFKESHFDIEPQTETVEAINWLANSNYSLKFSGGHGVSERVIFPVSELHSRGIEDARFVQFEEDNGQTTYFATYTAYNGSQILPQLIETSDFEHFKIITLNGLAVQNKGMALFPRKVNGKYVMLSRQDGENNHIMYSEHLHFWESSTVIQQPTESWEFVQIGNCGSPIEIAEGWLVLTHGVGAMREYSIGAILLDLNNPSRIIARLKQPLLCAHDQEREGYVPNVVYSCGALVHGEDLIIPYAMSDISSGLASVNVQELINCMEPAS
jgi:predicted GH43/DUF377 family glycosyl hydrolase